MTSPTSNLKPYWSHDYRSYDPGLNADGPPTKMYLAADVEAEIERLRSSSTATALLHAHWEKLAAELPDVYDYLQRVTVSEGKPFEFPGMGLTVGKTV